MKITGLRAYRAGLPYAGGEYWWGPGQVIRTAETVVVVLDTDAGLRGCGECCPIGGSYLAAYAEGIAPALARLAPAILGLDPRAVHAVERAMERALKGHPYAKSAIDVACWDLLGKSAALPVHVLLGGKLTDGAPMYRVIPQKSRDEALAELAAHRARGYRQFQIKVGGDPDEDVERVRAVHAALEPGERAYADANTGWTVHDAVRVVRALSDLDVLIEQPCLTYEECLQVRARTTLPMKLDECVTDLRVAERIVADRAAEVACLKLSNLGGLTKARRVRDYLVEHGISVVSEDTWGGEITSAAVSHFAASTPPELLYNTTDLHAYSTASTGHPAPPARGGKLYASDAPGLGVEPDLEALGEPIASYRE